jgi:uncharacterized membrane protein
VTFDSIVERLKTDRGFLQLSVWGAIAVALLLIIVVIPYALFDKPESSIDQGKTDKATVTRILEERMQDSPNGPELYQRLELQVGTQPIVIERTAGKNDSRNFEINAGDRLLVTGAPSGPNGETVYFISDRARDGSLVMLLVVFTAVVILIARWQGALSLVGMGLSLLVILRFIIPGILDGYDPVLISVLGAVVIMASSLYLSHGINRKTTTAFVGTGIALALTAVLAGVGISITRLSGLADEQAATLRIITDAGIQPEGLLLAGIIIGALGVLDDVCVAQASAVFELKGANPALHGWDLFDRAMNIGRDHIASTVNTLFLAYAGAALPLMIILSLGTEPASVLVNRDFLATEIVRTLIGSMGIVASVPLTTGLAAWSLRGGPHPHPSPRFGEGSS